MIDGRRYTSWADVPAGLRPENDLRFAGLEPAGEAVAWLVLDGREIALFREADATPRARTPPPARGSIDPARSSHLAPGSAGSRAAGTRRDVAALPALGSLHRAVGRRDPDAPPAEAGAGIRRLRRDDFVVGDTETTGLGYADEVIELGVVGPDGQPWLSTLVRPRSGRVPPGATAVHGLTMADLAGAPTFPEVYEQLRVLAGGRRVIAWNAPFDERMVRQSASAWGLRERLRGFECAMRAYALARGLRHGRAKLERAGLETGLLTAQRQAHRSTDDARLALQVLMRVGSGR